MIVCDAVVWEVDVLEVSLDRCSVDCHVFLFVVGEDGQ